MILDLLHEASRTAGAAMGFAALACLCTGAFGVILSLAPGSDPRGQAAMRLTRSLAVFGGACGLVGALMAVPYFWMVGEISQRTFILTEAVLLGGLAVWAVVVAALLDRGEAE